MVLSQLTAKALETFAAACADPYAAARDAAESGRGVAGYQSHYAPVELLHAAGYLPVRMLGQGVGTMQSADSHMQPFTCSFARGILETGLCGGFDFMDIALFAHTCDTMQNMSEVWKWNVKSVPVLMFALPTRLDGEAAAKYYQSEVERVKHALEQERGTISDEALRSSMEIYAEQRLLMRRLYASRAANPYAVSGVDMMRVVLASFLMPVKGHLESLRDLLGDFDDGADKPSEDGPRVILAGNELPNADYVAAIEAAGCTVVDDDFSTGSQAFSMSQVEADDPIKALAGSYLSGTPGNAQYKEGFQPGAHLVKKALRAKADCVVFLLTKFCDPCFFDYPSSRDALEAEGIRTLLLEIEVNQPPGHQLKTRVAAFVEMFAASQQR